MSRFILHVGYPKTASTSLQKLWFPRLSDCGYYYRYIAEVADNAPTNPVRQFKEYSRGERLEPASEIIENDRVLLSSEGIISDCIRQKDRSEKFSPRPIMDVVDQCRHAAIMHGATEPKVIVCLREQLNLMHSFYAQAYAHWFSRFKHLNTFDRYIEWVLSNDSYAQVYEFDLVVKKFFEVFGEENVLVHFYENLCQDSRSFGVELGRFLEVEFPPDLGRLNERASHGGGRVTQPISVKEGLMHLKARAFPGRFLGVARYLRGLDNVRLRGAKWIPGPEPWAGAVRCRFRGSNERLAQLLGRDLAQLGYL